MNGKQKKLLLIFIILFVLSALFVPQEFNFIIGGNGDQAPESKFQGYRFIGNVNGEIAIKHIFVEWAALFTTFFGLFFYFKES